MFIGCVWGQAIVSIKWDLYNIRAWTDGSCTRPVCATGLGEFGAICTWEPSGKSFELDIGKQDSVLSKKCSRKTFKGW